MKKNPRYYQQDAFNALVNDIGVGMRPYVSMSTGSGKALVCAMLAEKALKQGVRVLILVPSSELVVQNYKEHFAYTDNPEALGICSAKLQKAEVKKQIVYATYTSFLRRRTASGSFNLLVIDECHLVSPADDSSYQKIIRSLLRINPQMKICGLTATPYRSEQGMLHEDCLKGTATFTNCAYETNIPKLIEEGYLSHVESISGDTQIDLEGVTMKGSDYDQALVGVKFDAIVTDAVTDMRIKFQEFDIKTAIIYASTLDNARTIMTEWGDPSTMRIVFGDMPEKERKSDIKWLSTGEGCRYIVNVGILVTGFDYQLLDCVVMFMATKSLVKYTQIAGRVIRAHEDKALGYVLDYGSNIERHGPIDATIPPRGKKRRGEAPKKLCLIEGCGFPNLLSAKYCKECGAMFVSNDDATGLYSMKTKAQILTEKNLIRHKIMFVTYGIALSKAANIPMIKMGFLNEQNTLVHTQFICVEHPGFAGEQARRFLMDLFKDPKDFFLLGREHTTKADRMAMLLNEHKGFFKEIKGITLKKKDDSKYSELSKLEFA